MNRDYSSELRRSISTLDIQYHPEFIEGVLINGLFVYNSTKY